MLYIALEFDSKNEIPVPIKSSPTLKPKSGSSSLLKSNCASRRRDSTKHKEILQATRVLLEETGYRGLSVKSIANKAGVSRNVLYNWWGGEVNRIVEEALLPNVNEWTIPNHGNFKDDIEEIVDLTIDAINRPNVLKGFLILAAEVVNNDDELIQTTKYFRAPYARIIGHILKNAETRGEIAPNQEAKNLAQLIAGSAMQFSISKTLSRKRSKAVITDFVIRITEKKSPNVK